ncbi:hypothetical protein [uncultured Alcanivorax sp.]|uniref:hypothetical protein n=1 Tax=uncultured Alcanivorax sp. TaxID=191215 RepID=UPI0032B11E93
MAGDWIKFEISTHEKPEVWAIAERLDVDPDAVVGKLLRVWAWFDQHTETGNAPTVTKKLLDRHVCVSGFCDAVIDAGWMCEEDGTIFLPNFDRHNGKTAKTRATTAKRVAAHKSKERTGNAEGNDKGNADTVTGALPKEEKRREEKNKENTPPVSPQGGKAKRAAQLPEDFRPNETNKRLAEELGVSLVTEFPQFCDHHQAKGSTMKDWHAAMNTWIRNAHRFARSGNRQAAAGQKETPRERAIRMAAERGIPYDPQ